MRKYLIILACLACSISVAMAQTIVKGIVYEPSGEPAIGATVIEKGNPTNGASTGIDGDFSVKVSSPDAVLTISYIGMRTQEVKVGGRSEIEVTLESSDLQLDELVVVGYGVQKKINATGSVRTIDNQVLESRPVTNAVQGLQGAIAGLNITNNNGGELGAEMNINIRGVGSIGEGSESSPLILIDGMEGSLDLINPADIESISVLKDAAAASIYGSRAPFGVILITTKSGEKGTRVNYSANMRVAQPVKVPNSVDGLTYAYMVNEAFINSGSTAQISDSQIALIKKYMAGEINYATEQKDDGSNEWKTGDSCFGNTDWYDVYLKDATVSQEHNFTVNGGSDKVNYYLSANYMEQSGLFNYADEEYTRLALTAKVGVKFNEYVRANWTTRYISVENDKPSALNSTFYHNLGRRSPLVPIYLPNGTYSGSSLIQAMSDGGRVNSKTQQLYNQGSIEIEPIKGWKIHADINSRIENNPYTRQFKPIYEVLPDGSLNALQVIEGVVVRHEIKDDGSFRTQPDAGESYFEKAQTNINYFTTNVYTDYTLDIAEDHHFKFLIGEQSEYYRKEITRVASYDILLDDTPFISSSVGDEYTMVSESKGEWSSLGFFGRLNYNYADRYMLEANIRTDGASRFPEDQRWGTFPSFSVGWNIAQEPFWDKWRHVCEYLKIRASYGVLGNQNTTSFYPYYQSMTQTSGSLVIGGSQATVLPMYDPYSTSLTWERIENYGLGLDWGFLRNRLTGSFDWYQRTTKDMVGPATSLAAVYGADAPDTNNAELRTRGWEFEIAWRDQLTKDFSYGISASISDYKSVVTKYDSPDNDLTGWYEGKVYGDIWGYKVVGIAQSDDEMAAYLAEHSQSNISSIYQSYTIGSNWGAGDLMYADLNGDGSVDAGSGTLDDHGDLVVIGNSTPRYSYSFTLEAQWKWIDFRAYFQGVGKRDVFFTGSATFFGFGTGAYQRSLFTDHLDYFRLADSELGANFDAYYGRLRTDGNNKLECDRFLQDASYLRCKNIQVGFNLPDKSKLKKWVKKARLYVSVENLFTITNLKIFDPEAIDDDGDYAGQASTYPQYRTYSVGLDITF